LTMIIVRVKIGGVAHDQTQTSSVTMAPRNNLDILRSVAVLSVVGAHTSNALGHDTNVEWHFGQLGVLVFFVHTALVLMLSMDRMGEQSIIGRFYVRRAARIYPLAIFCVLISYLLSLGSYLLSLGWFAQYNFFDFITNLMLTQNLFYRPDMVPALWTLPLEVQMYVVLPLLFIRLRNRHPAASMAVWLASVPLAIVSVHDYHQGFGRPWAILGCSLGQDRWGHVEITLRSRESW